jgi:hypothetical protein
MQELSDFPTVPVQEAPDLVLKEATQFFSLSQWSGHFKSNPAVAFSFSEMYPVDIHSLVFSPFLRNFKVSVQILFSQIIFYILDILREPPPHPGFRKEQLTAQKGEVGKQENMEAVLVVLLCYHFQRWFKGHAHVRTSHSSFDLEAPAYYYYPELNEDPPTQ